MDNAEKKSIIDSLIEKGTKNGGKLSSSDIDMVLVDSEIDIEDMEKIYVLSYLHFVNCQIYNL